MNYYYTIFMNNTFIEEKAITYEVFFLLLYFGLCWYAQFSKMRRIQVENILVEQPQKYGPVFPEFGFVLLFCYTKGHLL